MTDETVSVREDGFMRLTARFKPRGSTEELGLPPLGEPVAVIVPGREVTGATSLDVVAVGTSPEALADLLEATADALRFGIATIEEGD
jgi:hypothetical protein